MLGRFFYSTFYVLPCYYKKHKMPTVLITGGTGTVGKRLTQLLIEKGYDVNILSRSHSKPIHGINKDREDTIALENNAHGKLAYYKWDLANQYIDPAAIGSADFIVHLAGAGVADKRWTEARKKEIANSRTQSSALIVSALKENPNHVKAVISASAIGWYGPDGSNTTAKKFVETDLHCHDFLGETCRVWEASIEPVTQLNKRLVILRTGIVLSNEGGALVEFKKPLLFKTAAILGNGKQIISWIHIDDLCNQYIYAIENQAMNGVYNAVAPIPVTNAILTKALARKVCGSFFITMKVPAFILKIMLGEMSIEILKSTTVSSNKIETAGFHFKFPDINKAVDELVG
jgi:uncharacterized protein (TIGR01777 family)